MVIVPQFQCQYHPPPPPSHPSHLKKTSHICSAGVYIKQKQSNGHNYSFGDYHKQYSDALGHNADERAQQDDQIDKTMHKSVRDAVMAILADDKDGTFRKVMYLIVNPQRTCASVTCVCYLTNKLIHFL